MDMAKYRVIFIEESMEHLVEMSSAMLELEKNLADAESIDLVFRMAHSIKGMAASLQYDSIAEVAHDLLGRIGRAIVHDDDLEIAPGLSEHALKGLTEPHRSVVGRDDDADQRWARFHSGQLLFPVLRNAATGPVRTSVRPSMLATSG